MTRETAAALMNWGHAPMIVTIFMISDDLREDPLERGDDPVLFGFSQIGPNG